MRLIVQFERLENIKYISQLDMLRTIHRALRRADIPVAYSEGFNPQPRVSFGFALSVGLVSRGEYMDIHLKSDIAPDEFIRRMNAVMPEGMSFICAAAAGDKTPKMGKMIDCAAFEVTFDGNIADKLDEFFHGDSIVIERHTKKGTSLVDVKDHIYSYSAENMGGSTRLRVIQALSEEMSVRIDDLVAAILAFVGERVCYKTVKINTLLRQGSGFVTPVEYTELLKTEQG